MSKHSNRVKKLEKQISDNERRKHYEGADGLIIYDADNPDEPEKSINEFHRKYPDFGYSIIVLPKKYKEPE